MLLLNLNGGVKSFRFRWKQELCGSIEIDAPNRHEALQIYNAMSQEDRIKKSQRLMRDFLETEVVVSCLGSVSTPAATWEYWNQSDDNCVKISEHCPETDRTSNS